MNRSPAITYLALAVMGLGLTVWLGYKIAFAVGALAIPQTVVTVLGLIACIILCATGLHFGMAFLFWQRFVAEVRHDASTFTLASASGRPLASAENIRIIKRVGNPYELATSESTVYTIFSADKRWWITPSATISRAESNVSSDS